MKGHNASRHLVTLFAAIGLFWSSAAVAQAPVGFEVRTWNWASSQRLDYFTVESGETMPAGGFELGLMFTYLNSPLNLALDDDRLARNINHQILADLAVAWAPIHRLQFHLDVPIYLVQISEFSAESLLLESELEGAGIGGIRLTPKVMLVERGADGDGFALALHAGIVLPTGSLDRGQGDDGWRVTPSIDADYRFNRWSLGANLGYYVRPRHELLNLDVDDQLRWALAARFDVTDQLRTNVDGEEVVVPEFQIIGELRGGYTTVRRPDDQEPELSFSDHMEIDVGGRYLTDMWITTFGFGTGLIAGYGVPDVRIFISATYAPLEEACDEDYDNFEDWDCVPDPDNDEDGVLDVDEGETTMPNGELRSCAGEDRDVDSGFLYLAEDHDGFEDEDGCPEVDNDEDGVHDYPASPDDDTRLLSGDIRDVCPGVDADKADDFLQVAEDYDIFEDEDGCPEVDNDGDGVHDHPIDPASPEGEETVLSGDPWDQCPGTDRDVETHFAECGVVPDRRRDHWGANPVANQCVFTETYATLEDSDPTRPGCPFHVPPPLIFPAYFSFDVGGEVQTRSLEAVATIATLLRENPQIRLVRIEGHTDLRGTEEYNMELSQRRAQTVYRLLIREGVDPERLRVEWYGETRPFIPNATTEAEHQANRRVEFHIEDWGGGALNVETLPPEPLDPVGRTPEDPLDY